MVHGWFACASLQLLRATDTETLPTIAIAHKLWWSVARATPPSGWVNHTGDSKRPTKDSEKTQAELEPRRAGDDSTAILYGGPSPILLFSVGRIAIRVRADHSKCNLSTGTLHTVSYTHLTLPTKRIV